MPKTNTLPQKITELFLVLGIRSLLLLILLFPMVALAADQPAIGESPSFDLQQTMEMEEEPLNIVENQRVMSSEVPSLDRESDPQASQSLTLERLKSIPSLNGEIPMSEVWNQHMGTGDGLREQGVSQGNSGLPRQATVSLLMARDQYILANIVKDIDQAQTIENASAFLETYKSTILEQKEAMMPYIQEASREIARVNNDASLIQRVNSTVGEALDSDAVRAEVQVAKLAIKATVGALAYVIGSEVIEALKKR